MFVLCFARIFVRFRVVTSQSFDDSDSDPWAGTPKQKKAKKEPDDPAKASKAQTAKIEAELTKILKDEANDNMSYAGML